MQRHRAECIWAPHFSEIPKHSNLSHVAHQYTPEENLYYSSLHREFCRNLLLYKRRKSIVLDGQCCDEVVFGQNIFLRK